MQIATSVQRLHWLRPHPTVIGSKGDMTVIGLLPHRHRQPYAERSEHILMFIAIIYKGVNQLHLVAARIEIEPHRKGEPLATCLAAMHTLYLDKGPHTSGTFHRDLPDL